MNLVRYEHRAIALLFAICLFFPVESPAQTCQLSMSVSYTHAEELSVADVNFDHFQSHSLLFTMQIANPTPNTVQARLGISLNIMLADGSPTIDDGLMYTSEPFDVPPGGRTVTNLDLGQVIKTHEFKFNDEAKDRIRDIALSTRRFPAGTYTFDMELTPVDCGTPVSQPIVLEFRNPSRVELRSPVDGETVNEFPLFEYFMEGGQGTLRVAELLPGQSREDALSRRPLMLEADASGNAFAYAGGRPLHDGSTYVWQISFDQLLSGGASSSVVSPIWSFTVSGSAPGPAESDLIDQLEEIFGSRFPGIFDQIHRSGLSPTGRMTADGSSISQSDFLNMLKELREHADAAELTIE